MRVFHVLKSLGGCGGTIVSRCLAAAGFQVLSEVNPRCAGLFGAALNPLTQVRGNSALPLPAGWRDVDTHALGDPLVFGRFVAEFSDCIDRRVVIRDYSFVDYIGTPFIWPMPSVASLTPALRPFGQARVALLVRHPADCYKSLLGHIPLATLGAEAFVAGHLAMYDDNPAGVRVRFEDFIADPEVTMEALCHAMALPFEAAWRDGLTDAPRLTGNSRALDAVAIEPVSRRRRSEIDERLEAVPGYDRLLACGSYTRES